MDNSELPEVLILKFLYKKDDAHDARDVIEIFTEMTWSLFSIRLF